MTAPTNRQIAHAIADLGDAQLQAAATYCRTCIDLLAAGLPRAELPRALDIDRRDLIVTEPLAKLAAWARKPAGLISVIGPPGVGKSFAAQRVAIDMYRSGSRVRWLAAVHWSSRDRDAQKQWLAQGDAARVLVLDDVGAGATLGEYLRDEIEGLLLRRIADARPTIVISNASRAELSTYLGARLLDRMHVAGGVVEIAAGSKSLRKPAEVDLDASGRWPAWAHAQELLDLVGHDEMGSWQRLISRSADVEFLRAVAKRLGLERKHVIAAARSLEIRDRELLEHAGRALDVEVRELSLAGLADAIARKQQATQVTVVGARNFAPNPTCDEHLDDRAAAAARERLAPLGFSVTRGKLTGYTLRHNGRALTNDWPTAGHAWLDGLTHVGGFGTPAEESDAAPAA